METALIAPVGIYPRYWLAGYIDILHAIAASQPTEQEELKLFKSKTFEFFHLITKLIPHDQYRNSAIQALKDVAKQKDPWDNVIAMTRHFTSYEVGDKRLDYQNDPFGEASRVTFSRDVSQIKGYYSNLKIEPQGESTRPGISPLVWKRFWGFLHSMAADYPIDAVKTGRITIKDSENISIKLRRAVFDFLELLPYVLPCSMCRESIKMYLAYHSPEMFVINRSRLVDYFYELHEDVNKRKRITASKSDILLRRYMPYSRYKLYENNEYIHTDYDFLSSQEERKDEEDFY
jgi:hypothetical protein